MNWKLAIIIGICCGFGMGVVLTLASYEPSKDCVCGEPKALLIVKYDKLPFGNHVGTLHGTNYDPKKNKGIPFTQQVESMNNELVFENLELPVGTPMWIQLSDNKGKKPSYATVYVTGDQPEIYELALSNYDPDKGWQMELGILLEHPRIKNSGHVLSEDDNRVLGYLGENYSIERHGALATLYRKGQVVAKEYHKFYIDNGMVFGQLNAPHETIELVLRPERMLTPPNL
ncbi:hypothetical protein HN643_00540 [Candidatus Falkowbacteria bacterium]|jgi:hypothetical protein|nr:hypothetical protein [Candidatus Falkowbacteria bacterium]MBT5503343.1 hypothetical protein [Candidatus Falkowbacteria bacterium]MBT6573674.1 hypothetical protein [Candidatus Falkowbacteria bacterium]MBT7500145.1 hypothetical protein [Candidatus Falkowbacteria bacterium]